MKSIKKKSFVIILLVSFWLGYMGLSLVQTIYSSLLIREKVEESKNRQIEFILESTKDYLYSENEDLVKQQMNKAVSLQFIDLFCFRKAEKNTEKVISEYTKKEGDKACQYFKDYQVRDTQKFLKYSNVVIRVIQIDKYTLFVAYGSDLISYLKWEHKENIVPFIKDVIIITLFVAVLIFLILKDFLTIEQLLKKGDRNSLSEIKAKSKEAQALIDSTSTLDSINSQQKESISILQNTVGEALTNEIKAHTPSLTTIPCVVVRIDLNGYTQIFLEKKEEHIVTVLNEYFAVTNDIIKRYHGEIYQIIGDEVIFIFKNLDLTKNRLLTKNVIDSATQEVEQSDKQLRALFCVKAIFEWSRELDNKIYRQYGHRFLLKSSISHGQLRFVKLNTGYAFAGVPLIESVRLLGSVSDKNENTLIAKTEVFQAFSSILLGPTEKFSTLKGFDDDVKVYEIKEFLSMASYFSKNIEPHKFEHVRRRLRFLEYFRSREDIFQSLDLIDKYFKENNYNPVFYLIQSLKKSNVTIPEPEISLKLMQVLSDHFAIIKSKDMEYSFLPSLVLIVKDLVHKNLWSEKWEELIRNYLLSSNPRVVSNAIEVFEFYNDNISTLKNNLKSWQQENRILAVYLLAKLKRSLNATDVNELNKLLFSEKPLFKASALYVIEELLRFYFEKDPVVYKTNDYLQTLKGNVNKIEPNENEILIKRLQRVKSLMKSLEENLLGLSSTEIKIS